MKRVATAALLAALVLALCIGCRIVMERQIGRITDTMDQIDASLAAGDTVEALEISREFLRKWDAMHDQLCYFIQHEHLDPLENVFAVLPYYIEQGEISLARAQCRIVQTAAGHIMKTERVTPSNIL